MKHSIKKQRPLARGLSKDELNANSNSAFNITYNAQNIQTAEYPPEIDWLLRFVECGQRYELNYAAGCAEAARIAAQERDYCGSMHNGTATTNNPYLHDADPETWGDD